MNELQAFLQARRAKFGTQQRLADSIGLTFSGFLRGVKAGTLSAESCFRLAEVLGEQPADVLRAARKHDLADQFERLYGQTTNPISEEEREILEIWRGLTPRAREGLRLTMHELPRRAAKPDQEKSRRRRSGAG